MFGDRYLHELAGLQGWRVIAGVPVLGRVLFVHVELPGLERLQGYLGVAVVVGADAVEVVQAAAYRQVLGPPVFHSFKLYAAARRYLADAIGAATQWWLQAALAEVAGGPPVLGQHSELAQDHGQLAVVLVLEVEAHLELVLGHHLRHVGVVVAVQGITFFQEDVEGEDHILGRDRGAVVEACLGVEDEAHVAVVGSLVDLLGYQAVLGEGLVQRVIGQAVVDRADGCRISLGDKGVEAVETADATLAQQAALGCIRIDVLEVFEVRRVLGRLVVEGDGVSRFGLGRAGQHQQGGA